MKILTWIILSAVSVPAFAQSSGKFELIADYRDIGGLNASAVGPGPSPGTQRFYASYTYAQNTFDVLSIDPTTGNTTVFPNPVLGEWAGYGMAVGPDGSVYLGTAPSAHFVKLDPKRGTLVDLGRPSSTEEWIFDVAFGADDRLYGVTFPHAKLVRYSPKTGVLEDLGRLDPTEQYARYIVSSKDGFLYIAIGTSKSNVAAYRIATMQKREILPPDAQVAGTAKVYQSQDGNVYASTGNRLFRIDQWKVTEITGNGAKRSPASVASLRDGSIPALTDENGALRLSLSSARDQSSVDHNIRYSGEKLSLFRITLGPDNVLFGSSALPAHLVQFDLPNHSIRRIGDLGAGEVYSFLGYTDRLLMGVYAGLSPLMCYQPAAPFHPGAGRGNPVLYSPSGILPSWRPMAMITGPDQAVYVGAVAGYGQLESPLVRFSPETGSVERFEGIVHNQSIQSLTVWRNFVVGGTTINGGGGSHPTASAATLFLWDTATRQKRFETIPVPGKTAIIDLITAPNDHIYGIADDTLFEFDPKRRAVVGHQALPFSKAIYNSIGVDEAGTIWGLAKEGIFSIDPRTSQVRLIAPSPIEITGGFALHGGKIYFIANSSVYSYTM